VKLAIGDLICLRPLLHRRPLRHGSRRVGLLRCRILRRDAQAKREDGVPVALLSRAEHLAWEDDLLRPEKKETSLLTSKKAKEEESVRARTGCPPCAMKPRHGQTCTSTTAAHRLRPVAAIALDFASFACLSFPEKSQNKAAQQQELETTRAKLTRRRDLSRDPVTSPFRLFCFTSRLRGGYFLSRPLFLFFSSLFFPFFFLLGLLSLLAPVGLWLAAARSCPSSSSGFPHCLICSFFFLLGYCVERCATLLDESRAMRSVGISLALLALLALPALLACALRGAAAAGEFMGYTQIDQATFGSNYHWLQFQNPNSAFGVSVAVIPPLDPQGTWNYASIVVGSPGRDSTHHCLLAPVVRST
jgi:hypothetical protein